MVRRAGLLVLVGLLTACGDVAPSAPTRTDAYIIHGTGAVNVAYAGTLAGLFEQHVRSAFEAATGFRFQGEAKGSIALANLIRDRVRTPDVFISADQAVNVTLAGPENGGFVSWWVTFAGSELVIGWSPLSRFAADFEQARQGSRTWESVLAQPGLRLGRTDPEIDPKGYRTVIMFQLDEQRTGDPSLSRRILGSASNPGQLFLEEQLVARLQAGELDAGVFFRVEAVAARIPFLNLAREINQGDPALAQLYANAHYTNRRGVVQMGSPVLYTLTIPTTVRNRPGALALCQFLLSGPGRAILASQGLELVAPAVGGDRASLPAELADRIRSSP